jgi:signal peptide peptidase SppA
MHATECGAAVLAQAGGSVWACQPEAFASAVATIDHYNANTPPEAATRSRDRRTSDTTTAVIPLQGLLLPRGLPGWFGDLIPHTSLSRFQREFSAAAMTADRVVLDVDSPGGSVGLVAETADLVRRWARALPVAAVVNTLAASAAYWIASQASEVFSTPSGLAGSVGVFSIHLDQSEQERKAGRKWTLIESRNAPHKTEWSSAKPLSDEARQHEQRTVDEYARRFVADVASGRDLSRARIEGDFGQGRLLTAVSALSVGMVDGLKTLDEVIYTRSPSERRQVTRAALAALAEESAIQV